MKIRHHLTYANVMSTVALVLVIGGGGAYAAGFIDSGDIVNNSIESRDLENREAVKARDVRRNGLTGKEIKEQTLAANAFAPLSGNSDSGCDPANVQFLTCVSSAVRLRSAGRALAIATGEFVDAGGGGVLDCRIFVDGDQTGAGVTPGDNDTPEDSFTVTLVTNRLTRGQHQISLRCQQEVGDGQLASSSIAVLGISG